MRDEPVFYNRLTGGNPPVHYPADLYRANFLGTAMFMDEPASVVTWDAHIAGGVVRAFCGRDEPH